ncbi:chemotaxis protein CheW [Pseudomonas oryzihabitans]|uniref:chemotaxis protein CheW n=1 Tax=Pseudomonas oryzihabitans TaxID=47885 RepID=UPI0028547A8A|nr:chemotaxis protein CheW [Pseudomonas psychrotolerans]MDR6675974.1 chemotaxis-related protein WspB [Pseudomonas psychrotolerans]
MQILIFHLADEPAALPTVVIRQVLPFLELTRFPAAPPGVAGLMNLHGVAIPVIDVTAMSGGRGARAQQDTRILLVDYPLPGTAGGSRPLGLVVEGVLGVRRVAASAPRPAGIPLPSYPWLGEVLETPEGLWLWLEPQRLLSPALADLLFRGVA